jgi:hypothetical protein
VNDDGRLFVVVLHRNPHEAISTNQKRDLNVVPVPSTRRTYKPCTGKGTVSFASPLDDEGLYAERNRRR